MKGWVGTGGGALTHTQQVTFSEGCTLCIHQQRLSPVNLLGRPLLFAQPPLTAHRSHQPTFAAGRVFRGVTIHP